MSTGPALGTAGGDHEEVERMGSVLSGDRTSLLLQAAMGASASRQELLAHNIANVSTPGYRRKDIAFDQFLREITERSVEEIPHVRPRVTVEGLGPRYSMRPDGNTVDIDREVSELTRNTMTYTALSQIMSMRFSTLWTALKETR